MSLYVGMGFQVILSINDFYSVFFCSMRSILWGFKVIQGGLIEWNC